MIVASFLVKNLFIHWHEGEAWFWDCLVDADLANNSASWQWVAGCGADATPYFGIFNPIPKAKSLIPIVNTTKHYVPELKSIPIKYLFNRWQAPADILAQANVSLGTTYPKPLVDVKVSHEKALAAFASLKDKH